MLRTVAAFIEPWEAHMFSSRLEAEGIPSFVEHSQHVGNAWHFSLCLGGAKVQVLAEDVSEAHAIEKLCCRGELRAVLEPEFGALEEVHCPNCGATEKWKRRPFLRAVAAISISLTFGMILPPLGWVYFCERCGTKYRAPVYIRPIREWLVIAVAIVGLLVVLLVLALILQLLLSALIVHYWFVPAIFAVMVASRWLIKWINGLNAEVE